MSMPYTPTDDAAARSNHTPTAAVYIRPADGSTFKAINVRRGSVRFTAGSYPSVTATIDLADLDQEYLTPTEPFTPYGNRITVQAGINNVLWPVADLLITDVTETVPGRVYTLTAASDEVLAAGKMFARPTPILDPDASWTEPGYVQIPQPPILPGSPAFVRITPRLNGPYRGESGVVSAGIDFYWANCLPTSSVAAAIEVEAATGGGAYTVTGDKWGDPSVTQAQFTVTGWTGGNMVANSTMLDYTPTLSPTAVGSAWNELRRLISESMPGAAVIADQPLTDMGLAQATTWTGTYLSCVQTCLTALGAELWVDPARQIHVRPAGSGTGDPTTYLYLYGPQATVTAYDGSHTRAPNTAYVWGYNDKRHSRYGAAALTDGPLTAIGYGHQDVMDSWPYATTGTELDDIAARNLDKASRRGRTVTISQPAMPWLQLGDSVELNYTASRSEPFTIRSIELPLGPGVQRIELVSQVGP